MVCRAKGPRDDLEGSLRMTDLGFFDMAGDGSGSGMQWDAVLRG
jgi:hypothetical protein